MPRPLCSIDGCDTPIIARKMCSKHYNRWKRNGDPHRIRKLDSRYGATAEDHFWFYVYKSPSDHWIWLGPILSKKHNRDYGLVMVDGRQMLAHRFAYEMVNGPIPDGLVIDHLCRIPRCVNPAHLEAVTQAVNIERGHRHLRGRLAA